MIAPVRATPHIFTRAQIRAALDIVDLGYLSDAMYSRFIGERDGGRPGAWTALALDIDTDGDALSFALAITPLLGGVAMALDFAGATVSDLPGHPSCRGRSAVWWPGYVLDEPTEGEWSAAITECCGDLDDRCPAHERAPWEQAPEPAGATA